jgi:hypothetical protein
MQDVTSVSLAQIKGLPPQSPERREAVRTYLRDNPHLRLNAARKAGVDPAIVSRVLHGVQNSEPVEKAIEAEERLAQKGHK